MKILYIGDIMAKPGRQVVAKVLPKLKTELKLDLVVAQSENTTHGKGISPQHVEELREAGVDVFTGGNHSIERPATHALMNQSNSTVLRPENMDRALPGRGFCTVETKKGKVLVISILGVTFPNSHYVENPLHCIDRLLIENKTKDIAATVVNFHGDFSSDKRIIGYYLDGRVSLVLGDHWHVPTADAMILPRGSAHMTDVGMCGTLHSSLGLEMNEAIARWKEDRKIRHEIAEDGPYQFNALYVEVDKNGLAKKTEHIQKILKKV
jgi:hypothetical protein